MIKDLENYLDGFQYNIITKVEKTKANNGNIAGFLPS